MMSVREVPTSEGANMDTHYHDGRVCDGRRLHPDDGEGCYTHAELDAWEATHRAAVARTEADDYEDDTDYEAERYAEFGSSWVFGGGRAEDVPAAWRQHQATWV